MNPIYKFIFIICPVLLLFNLKAEAQSPPFIYYPLDSISGISGNFADIRSHHFHSGIDFRTCSREGLPVYAVDSGYIARIFISPYGFGKALYIKHNSGYTSVYAHLCSFNDSINSFIKKEQYKRQSFSMDLILKKGEIRVKTCELIGYSGNSGSSEGPHLHFETRNSKSEKTINPAMLGYQFPDTIPPIIEYIKLYPAGQKSCINRSNKAVVLKVETKKKSVTLAKHEPLYINGGFSIGINAYDKINNSKIKYDLHGISISIDTILIFSCSADSFSFNDTRFVDTYIDYHEHEENKRDFVRTYVSPNNGLEFYRTMTNHGIFNLTSEGTHLIKIVVTDNHRNETVLSFHIIKDNIPCNPGSAEGKMPGKLCLPEKINVFFTATGKLEIPKNALFDTTIVGFKEISQANNNISSLYCIYDSDIPLFKKAGLSIKATNIPEKLKNKALIVRVGNKGEIFPLGGEWNNGFLKASILSFGTFKIMLDTVAPVILLKTDVSHFLNDADTIKLAINDELSGIDFYKPMLNGNWVPMDYDVKNSQIVFPVKEGAMLNENYFRIIVGDKKGNTSCFEFEFIKD